MLGYMAVSFCFVFGGIAIPVFPLGGLLFIALGAVCAIKDGAHSEA